MPFAVGLKGRTNLDPSETLWARWQSYLKKGAIFKYCGELRGHVGRLVRQGEKVVQERAGRATAVTAGGELLVAAPSDLDARSVLGRLLVDARRETVAKVTDVIGPVREPILVARVMARSAAGANPPSLVGRDLWIAPPRDPRGRDDRRGPPGRQGYRHHGRR